MANWDDVSVPIERPAVSGWDAVSEPLPRAPNPNADRSFSGAAGEGIAGIKRAFGATAEVAGLPELGKRWQEAGDKNYESATDRFVNPKQGDFTIGGFAPEYLPRSLVENLPNLAGGAAAMLGGAKLGGIAGSVVPGVGTAVGAAVGAVAAPLFYYGAQIFGETAKERAKSNGRPEPNAEDMTIAFGTALASGALDTLAQRMLPGGTATAKTLGRRILHGASAEGSTEFAQSMIEGMGKTMGTEKGYQPDVKEAIGSGIIGSVLGGGMSGAFGKRPDAPVAPPDETGQLETAIEALRAMTPPNEAVGPELKFETPDDAKSFLLGRGLSPSVVDTFDEPTLLRVAEVQKQAFQQEEDLLRAQEKAAADAETARAEDQAKLAPEKLAPALMGNPEFLGTFEADKVVEALGIKNRPMATQALDKMVEQGVLTKEKGGYALLRQPKPIYDSRGPEGALFDEEADQITAERAAKEIAAKEEADRARAAQGWQETIAPIEAQRQAEAAQAGADETVAAAQQAVAPTEPAMDPTAETLAAARAALTSGKSPKDMLSGASDNYIDSLKAGAEVYIPDLQDAQQVHGATTYRKSLFEMLENDPRVRKTKDGFVKRGAEAQGKISPDAWSGKGRYAAGKPSTGASSKEAAKPPMERDAALRAVNERLERIRKLGPQGEEATNVLSQLIDAQELSPKQVAEAFRMGEIVGKLMGKSGERNALVFMKAIAMPGGGRARGHTIERTADNIRGLMRLSLEPKYLSEATDTAAHESFHVLQEMFARYDHAAARALNRGFKDAKTLDDIDPSLLRTLKSLRPKEGSPSYYDSIQDNIVGENSPLAGLTQAQVESELQAYVFGALYDAEQNGQRIPGLAAAYRRFLNFLTEFFRNARTYLNGEGYSSAEDVMRKTMRGEPQNKMDVPEAIDRPVDAPSPAPSEDDLLRGVMGDVVGPKPKTWTPSETSSASGAMSDLFDPMANQGEGVRQQGLYSAGRSKLEEFQELYMADTPKPGPFRGLMEKLTGAVPGEKLGHAILRNTTLSALPFHERAELKHLGRTIEATMQTQGRIAGMLAFGPPVHLGGSSFGISDKLPGLVEIFRKVGERGKAGEAELRAVHAAMRELKLRAIDRGGLDPDGMSDADLQEVIDRASPDVKEAIAKIDEFNNLMLDMAVSTGLISSSRSAEFKALMYTPFYRAQEKALSESGKENITLVQSFYEAMKNPKKVRAFDDELRQGGKIEAEYYESLLKNYSAIMGAALRNVAYQETAKSIGDLQDPTIGHRVSKPLGQTIQYRVDGEDKYFKINDVAMFQAISAMTPEQRNSFVKSAAWFAGLLRKGVTYTPGFQIANLYRGFIDTWAKTGMPISELGAGMAKGALQVWRKGPTYQKILMGTGSGGYGHGEGFGDQAAKMRRDIERRPLGEMSIKNFGDAWMRVMDFLERLGETSEMAPRVAYYEYLKKQGKSDEDASWEAANLINFGRKGAGHGALGSAVATMIPMVPFLNARIQGMYRLLEPGTAGAPKQMKILGIDALGSVPRAIAVRALWLLGAEMLLNAWQGDEDWYKDLRLEDRVLNNHIRIGDTTFVLPRPFELGSLYGAIPAIFVDAVRQDRGDDIARGLALVAAQTFLFDNVVGIPLPQAIKPIINVGFNKNSLSGNPVETERDMRLPKVERKGPSTPAAYVHGSEALDAMAKMVGKETPLSPKQLEELSRGYLGTMANIFASLYDGLASQATVRPAGYFGDPNSVGAVAANVAGLRRFIKGQDEVLNRYGDDFYRMKSEVMETYNSIKDAHKRGDLAAARTKMAEMPAVQGLYTRFNQVGEQLTKLNAAMEQVRNSKTMTSEEKALRLDQLRDQRTMIQKRVVEQAKSAQPR